MAGYRRQNAQRFPNLRMRRFLPSKKLWPLSVRMGHRIDVTCRREVEACTFLPFLVNCHKKNPEWILRSVSSLSTVQPERGRQSTAKRAKRVEFIERSETVDGCRSGGYCSRAKVRRRQTPQDCAR